MSGLGTIDDLIKENKNAAKSARPLSVSSQETEEKFGKKMDDIKKKELEKEAVRYAAKISFPHIDLNKFPITYEALRQVDLEQAQDLKVICFFLNQDEIRLGAVDPKNKKVEELLKALEDKKYVSGKIYTISEASLARVLELYKTLPIVKPISKDIEIMSEDLEKVQAQVDDFRQLQSLLDRATTTDIVTLLLGAALKVEASDVHVEAEEEKIAVRFRLDGILHDSATVPKEAYKQFLSRIKLVSGIKLNITDKPQDGRFTIKLPNNEVDVRVSTIPTVFGESVVMRLLSQDQEGITLENLGLRGHAFEVLQEEIKRPNGMILTSGPTGSGKTTTLYAVLKILNKPAVKIITLEDPVEYRLEGVNQSQIDRIKEYTFGKGLKSILRQDPDIVMVGEIRDLETADIAIQAALTGHLMLSTVHTNSASGAVPRFISMGVKPFLLGPALNCIMGQRLVRKVCEKCKKEIKLQDLDSAVQARIEKTIEELPPKEKEEFSKKELKLFISQGCEECNEIGYKGRVGIFEVFKVDDTLEQAILAGSVSEHDIEKIAREQGMLTMVQDGFLKAAEGITTVDEIFRVID